MSRLARVVLACLTVAALSTMVFAQMAGPSDQASAAPRESSIGVAIGRAIAIIGACLGAAGAAIGGGFGIARIGGQCIDAIARQPEAASSMFAPMIITAAMVEGGMLFAMVVCLLGVLYI